MSEINEIPDLARFYDMVKYHDWFHEMSDSYQVHVRGAAAWEKLKGIAEQGGEEYKNIMKQWSEYHYSGKPWGTEKKPKPERPN